MHAKIECWDWHVSSLCVVQSSAHWILMSSCFAFLQHGYAWPVHEEGPCFEPGHHSFDRRHFLELWIQNWDDLGAGDTWLLQLLDLLGFIELLYCSKLLILLSLLELLELLCLLKLLMLLCLLMLLFLLYDFARSALIWVFLIIFGPINVLQLRNGLMIWEMSSVLQCARDGWLISGRPMLSPLLCIQLLLDRVNWSCPTTMRDGCEPVWGPWPPGLVSTLNTDANHSFVYPNNRNNCSNNDNNWQ